MRLLVLVPALLAWSGARAEAPRGLLAPAPAAARLKLDMDSVFERAMGAAHVGLTDGKVKFLRVRNGQREDVAAPVGRHARVMPVVDLNFHAASLLTKFVFW